MRLACWRIASFLLVATLLDFGFVNCSGFTPADLSAVSPVTLSSQCPTSFSPASSFAAKAAPKTDIPYNIEQVCNSAGHYDCDERIFKPRVGNQESQQRACSTTVLGQVCLNLKVVSFDTTANLQLPDLAPGAYQDGGEFNHVEVHCSNNALHHQALNQQARVIFEAEAPTLDEALNQVIAKCQTRRL